MAAVKKISSWISGQWRRGWETIPVVMICQCVTTPMAVATVIYKVVNRNSVLPAEKYRMAYTVMRSDDPRIARINHESRLDTVGFLWPKMPYYQYPM